MDKIELTEDEKSLLFAAQQSKGLEKNQNNMIAFDNLLAIEFVRSIVQEDECLMYTQLSAKGKRYLQQNPKLKNSSILDDKKFWITTGISLTAVIISVIALIKSIK